MERERKREKDKERGRRDSSSRDKGALFANVINSTHTGCLSHSTIEGAELSIPRTREDSRMLIARYIEQTNYKEKKATPSKKKKKNPERHITSPFVVKDSQN